MDNIKLRPLRSSDAAQIAKLANNKKIWDNQKDMNPYPYLLKDAENLIDLAAKQTSKYTFGIIVNEDVLCGVMGLSILKDVYRQTGEIGFWLGEQFWGKGIATKVIQLITEYGFEKHGLERIQASVFDFNIASMKALEKNGFKKEGVFRNSVIKNNIICDEHKYAKLKNE